MSEQHSDPVETVGHERRDVNIMSIVIFMAALEISMFLCALLGYAFNYGYMHWVHKAMPHVSPLSDVAPEPPLPRLQVDPADELRVYREQQTGIVESYGWLDPQRGAIRMPVERAKRLIAERGLPSRRSSEVVE